MDEELANLWKGFVSRRLGDPAKPPVFGDVSAGEAAQSLYAILPLFKAAPEGWRDALFDDIADDDADLIILRYCFGDPPDKRTKTAWRVAFERVAYCMAEFTLQDNGNNVMRMPLGLSEDDRRTALQLCFLLGHGRKIPPNWPGRRGSAAILDFPSGARRQP